MPGDDLLPWSQALPDWERDALRRIALTVSLNDADRDAIRVRLRHAHGIAVEGDTNCVPLTAADLPAALEGDGATILCGIGPARYVNRLSHDQELRFATNGVTLIYGDNASGKSGFTRIAKKLCQARVVDDLLGNVFAEQVEPPAEVRVRFRPPGVQEPQEETWRDGQPRPTALTRMAVLDGACARVYIDKQSEIIILPHEIEILVRLGELFTTLGAGVQREADAIEQRCRGAFGAGYSQTTTAGRLVTSLITTTTMAALPSDAAIREAAAWDEDKAAELAELTAALAQDPRAQAAARRRAAAALNSCAEDLEPLAAILGNPSATALRTALHLAVTTAEAAAVSAVERFADEPLPHTGLAAWKLMYTYARAFAAEAGLRAADQSFRVDDNCPLCQSRLDAEAAAHMQRFDDFVRSRAAQDADAAAAALSAAVEVIKSAQIPVAADIERNLAEYGAFGVDQQQSVTTLVAYITAATERRAAMLAGADAGVLGDLPDLPDSPTVALRDAAARLIDEARELDEQPAGDPAEVASAAELNDAKRLADDLAAVLARRADLELRLRLLNCKTALDTGPVSRFATQRRRELVTPELRDRIEAEIGRLDLSHLPLRFEEASERGRNFFDVVLATRRPQKKSAVLSEGEQSALGIACFLAEVGRVAGNHGIIVDDPVSSLDHQRIRKVAERLIEEAVSGRQVIIFTHNLVFYQEVLSAAASHTPPVPVLPNLITKTPAGQFGLVTENDEPWIAKKVTSRIAALQDRLNQIPAGLNRDTDDYRRIAKDFYTDLRETWERLVEEILLAGVVERFNASVKTQSLKGVIVDDNDYRVIFFRHEARFRKIRP